MNDEKLINDFGAEIESVRQMYLANGSRWGCIDEGDRPA
jgi:hypothetical protein